jgi:ribosome biogenesis GTPase
LQLLEPLGWDSFFSSQLDGTDDAPVQPARVAVEHRGRYQLIGRQGPAWATLAGRLRHGANSRLDLPAVGDWVGVCDGLVHRVLERRTKFVREAAGERTEPQVIAANIDVVFIVTSLNRDFNPRRIERYLIAVWDSGAQPVIVLNKADLCDDPSAFVDALGPLAGGVPVVAASALRGDGVDGVRAQLGRGRTGALVGSSGVGKSTIANALLGQDALAVANIRAGDAKGRHTTTHRELLLLPDDGGALIDTPGMRELALWNSAGAATASFDEIDELAQQCKFRDCSHDGEPGCGVRDAVDDERLSSHHKLQRELEFQHRKQDVFARKEKLRQWKIIHKSARKHRGR